MAQARPKSKPDASRKRLILSFLKNNGLAMESITLMDMALSHRSSLNEPDAPGYDNQRLEYLGDSVLGLVINEYLYIHYPQFREGQLARLRSKLVCESTLAGVAARLGIGPLLLLGKGERQSGGESRPSNLADAFEAVAAAIYLDQGLKRVSQFIVDAFAQELGEIRVPGEVKDPKSTLQEYVQRAYQEIPIYELIEKKGPRHQMEFHTRVMVQTHEVARAWGSSLKRSEQEAARLALKKLTRGTQRGPKRSSQPAAAVTSTRKKIHRSKQK